MQEHPFAQYIRPLARGKTKSRELTQEEARDAMGMILRREVEPEQIGAFLMLLRLREETAIEIAGFVEAGQIYFEGEGQIPADAPVVDVDWSSYAGKRKQLQWYMLAALTLVQNGFKVFMHGTDGHTAGRIYTSECVQHLGLPIAGDFAMASQQLKDSGFSYMPLKSLCPVYHELIELKHILGLRSPIHTVARMMNPFKSDVVLQGIFHPTFMPKHQEAAQLLGQKHLSVFRGEGGEIEVRPNKAFEVRTCHNGVLETENWPRIADDSRQEVDEELDLSRLEAVWRGQAVDDYADAAIRGTLAVALKTMQRADSIDAALTMAAEMWANRDTSRFI